GEFNTECTTSEEYSLRILCSVNMQILRLEERKKIENWLDFRLGIRDMARRLKRNHAVISRELKRNTPQFSRYRAELAQENADRRARTTNRSKIEKDEKLKKYVIEKLNANWSPEQISGKLKNRPPSEMKGITISVEAIYLYIYLGEGRFLGLYQHLRRSQRVRFKRFGRKPRHELIPCRVSIHSRPAHIGEKREFGHWESDSVHVRKHKGGISVQYEKKAMLARLHLVQDRGAEETELALVDTMEHVPAILQKSVTFDNGGEGANHLTLRSRFDMDTYFCDAYASYQKGGVENLNGLIRQYIPKREARSDLTQAELLAIQEQLNNRPRKSLQYKTPNEVFGELLKMSGALNH
ncbi:MAG: IS30 family transposase, partial [Actinomycetes bacterium]